MSAIITLTTDFGWSDPYVGVMKGVILSINPEAKLVDLCHTIKPQNIAQAAFLLSTTYQFFPEETIHVVVVDPGVGTKRRAIILRTATAYFVAPDNGVLSYIVKQPAIPPAADKTKGQRVKLAAGLQAINIINPEFWRSPVSATFHGRDILAPVAAWLSRGVPVTDFGEKTSSITVLPLLYPYQASDGSLVGQVLHIDSFGNLITNIRGDDLAQARGATTIEVGNRRIAGLNRTYAEGEGLLAIIGSSGYLELAVKGGSAAALLDARIGNEIKIRGDN